MDRIEESYCLLIEKEPQSIHHDGKLLGCCINHWGDYGSVFKDGLKSAMTGGNYRHAQKMLMGKAPPKPGIPCTTCKIYR